MEGIVLNEFKVKVKADMNLHASYGIEKSDASPIYENIKFEVIVDSDMNPEEIDRFYRITKERCPCYYCLATEIIPEIVFMKKGSESGLIEQDSDLKNALVGHVMDAENFLIE